MARVAQQDAVRSPQVQWGTLGNVWWARWKRSSIRPTSQRLSGPQARCRVADAS